MSKVMVSIESPFMASYLTSIVVSNIVSLMVLEVSDAEVLSPISRMVQGHLRSKVIVPIHSPWATYYSTSVNSNATFLGVHTQGAMTPKFKLGREFCTMHLPPSFIVLCLLVRKLSS